MQTLPLKPTFKLSEVAEIVGCSSRTIQRRIEEPKTSRYYLEARKTGKGKNSHYTVTRQALEEYLNRTVVGADFKNAA